VFDELDLQRMGQFSGRERQPEDFFSRDDQRARIQKARDILDLDWLKTGAGLDLSRRTKIWTLSLQKKLRLLCPPDAAIVPHGLIRYGSSHSF
jgi:hypothetical protein